MPDSLVSAFNTPQDYLRQLLDESSFTPPTIPSGVSAPESPESKEQDGQGTSAATEQRKETESSPMEMGDDKSLEIPVATEYPSYPIPVPKEPEEISLPLQEKPPEQNQPLPIDVPQTKSEGEKSVEKPPEKNVDQLPMGFPTQFPDSILNPIIPQQVTDIPLPIQKSGEKSEPYRELDAPQQTPYVDLPISFPKEKTDTPLDTPFRQSVDTPDLPTRFEPSKPLPSYEQGLPYLPSVEQAAMDANRASRAMGEVVSSETANIEQESVVREMIERETIMRNMGGI